MLKDFNLNKPILKLYYAEWCKWSQKFMPVWNNIKNIVNDCDFVEFEYMKNQNEFKGIEGFPTIILERGDKKIYYKGKRTEIDIINFINSN
jgi:hypothetical protein